MLHHTHAVRDIAAGEELTISYLDSFSTQAERKSRARGSWGFDCSCSQCRLPKKLSDASDAILAEIRQIEGQLEDLNKKVTSGLIEKLVKLYKKERLESKISNAYTLAALNYNLLGMAKQATKYAALAAEAALLERGPRSADVETMRELLKSPKQHWSWRGRLE